MVNWAIAVGINNYDNLQPLNYAKRDAEAMCDWFKEVGFDQVFLFTEDSPPIEAKPSPIPTQPTFGRFQRFLRAQFEKRKDNNREETLLQPGDNLWFFFAGHGARVAHGDYLMLSDSDPGNVEGTAISVNYVTERLRDSGADNVILFLDACRNEEHRSGLGIGNDEHKGVITFYSCAPHQRSYEIDQLNHGSFTNALLEGLQIQGVGNCATVERLEQYLRHQVPQINQRYKKPVQNPYAKVEPSYKNYFILLDQFATIKDAEPLKFQASLAENKGDLQLAEQLWIRVLAISKADWDAIEAIKRIALKNAHQSVFSSSVSPVTSESGYRSSSSETLLFDVPTNWVEFQLVRVNIQGEIENRETRQARYFTENLGNRVTLDLVFIPGGTFTMGARETEEGSSESERPPHQVTIKPFFMGKYPITQAQWQAVVSLPQVNRELNPDPSRFKGSNLPIERISWYEAVEFCDRLSQKTGKLYHLPSEAQWEYACRAGTTTSFHFGETITGDLANYDASETYANEPKGEYRGKTTPVGSFKVANAFGLYDMHGNVWEWCADHWHDNYQNAPNDETIWLSSDESFTRLLRGGSWGGNPRDCRSADRYDNDPGDSINFIGFRVVCTAAWTQ